MIHVMIHQACCKKHSIRQFMYLQKCTFILFAELKEQSPNLLFINYLFVLIDWIVFYLQSIEQKVLEPFNKIITVATIFFFFSFNHKTNNNYLLHCTLNLSNDVWLFNSSCLKIQAWTLHHCLSELFSVIFSVCKSPKSW